MAELTGHTVCDAAEAGGSEAVQVGLQEAIDILMAATKGCGSYAKPILRHITTVAEFAKRDGVQVCNSSRLHNHRHMHRLGVQYETLSVCKG